MFINFVNTARSLDFHPKALLMHYGVTAAAFIEQVGADANGVFGISMWTPKLPYRDDLFGSVYAYWVTFIDPRSVMGPEITDQMVVMVLIGGLGTIWGPALGGAACCGSPTDT